MFDDVISVSDCNRLLEAFAAANTGNNRAGLRSLMANNAVRDVAVSPALIEIAEDLLEAKPVPYKATLFEKTGKANWLVAFHQDTALPVRSAPNKDGWGPSSVKDGVMFSHAPTDALHKVVALRLHLDDSTELNGPLRVIPDSHAKRVLDDREFEQIVKVGDHVKCVIKKGGIIAMSPLIFHASSKIINDTPRRVLHIEYARSMDIAAGVRLAVA